MTRRIFAVDAETDGLYGEPFAIGAVVLDETGAEIASFAGAADVEAVRDPWVRENVLPVLGPLPEFAGRAQLRGAFWDFWMCHRENALCVADVGTPVEAFLFRLCVAEDESRTFQGPFPMHDLATLLLVRGLDPLASRPTLARTWGLEWTGKQHNPVDDARLTALLFRQSMNLPQS